MFGICNYLKDIELKIATGWNRTNDTRIFSPLLYQLSYSGVMFRNIYFSKKKVNYLNIFLFFFFYPC